MTNLRRPGGVARDADVLDSLRALGRATVTALAEHAGRTRGSVTRALSVLRRDRLAVRSGEAPGPGRPAGVWEATCP